ncbi:MAG: aminoglycoside phosphotransferase family protein [Bacteroidales bacterium]|nr:aminoglycoside phosphotransferase family protein [Bacteroidales bacterium]
MEQKLNDIAKQFAIEGTVIEVKPLGNGLINTTYQVATEGEGCDYVLQNVNVAIFPDIDLLMNNIVAVTGHIRQKLEAAGEKDIDRKVLEFVPAKDGKYYYHDGEKYWRVMKMIPDTVSKTGVSLESAYIVGETFADFQAKLADIPAQLGETIKDFHNIEWRLQQLADAVRDNKAGRLDQPEVQEILRELLSRAEEYSKSERLYREGKLPKRICHCDTKVDNILFDQQDNVLCVIDLDTVMPSFIFSDFGDFLRSAANKTREDDPNLDNVGFDFEVFKAFTRGYLKGGRCFLTPIEIENLPYATALFPYMQTVRFFADYLNGDTYFRIQYPEHNLDRTKNQLRLLQCVEEATPQMEAFIREQLEA